MNFEIVKTHKPLSVEGLGPSDAGFPIYFEESLPFTVALKVLKQYNPISLIQEVIIALTFFNRAMLK